MSIEIEMNSVTVTFNDPNDILELMDDKDKIDLIESLSCYNEVIKHVADQLVFGCTKNGSHGWISSGWNKNHGSALEKARNEIAKSASGQAKERIEYLEHELSKKCKLIEELEDKVYENQR